MMYFRGLGDLVSPLAPLTEKVGSNVTVTYPFPCSPIPLLDGRISVVLFIASCFLFGVFITELPVR